MRVSCMLRLRMAMIRAAKETEARITHEQRSLGGKEREREGGVTVSLYLQSLSGKQRKGSEDWENREQFIPR